MTCIPNVPEMSDWQPEAVYDDYFSSGTYSERYPTYNPRSLEIILRHANQATRILDFGCGEGRYTLPLLEKTSAHVVGCDISKTAIAHLHSTLHRFYPESQYRATLIDGEVSSLLGTSTFDVIIAMFGVLSHIAGRANRVRTLKTLKQLLAPNPNSVLIVSVPNAYRRFYKEQINTNLFQGSDALNAELEPGDIMYQRTFKTQKTYDMYYHLYTIQSLRQELTEAGLSLQSLHTESFFSESLITRVKMYRQLDHVLTSCLPSALGYGIVAIAKG